MSEGNPFILRLRERQGPLGLFHHSNTKEIALAVFLYAMVLCGLYYGGWEAAGLIFLIFSGGFFLLALFAAVGSVSHQVRIARTQNAWDELLVTGLTDGDLVNGQLLLALRPVIVLLWLSAPAVLLLLGGILWEIFSRWSLAEAIPEALGVIALIGILYGIAAITVLCLAVVSFASALNVRGAIARVGGAFLFVFLALTFSIVAALFFPVLILLPALCWYQHRVLCCSLRERLLADR
jgi:hypothetical protein